jgi:hypothetical protein
MTLDRAVACAVARASLLEAALHSSRPWFIQIGPVRSRARKIQRRHGIEFIAEFEDVPSHAKTVSLYEDNQLRSSRGFDYPGDGCFSMAWNVQLEESVIA